MLITLQDFIQFLRLPDKYAPGRKLTLCSPVPGALILRDTDANSVEWLCQES
jgi:hypothetical protein